MQCALSDGRCRQRVRIASLAVICFALAAVLSFGSTMSAAAATLDRVKAAGKLTLGYRIDAPPFSYRDDAGKAAGYSVALCQKIGDQVKSELGLASLAVEWVPVTPADRFKAIEEGKIDLLCETPSVTLERRKEVSFSIPIFPGGIGAMMRADGPLPLRALLAEGSPRSRPIWRGDPARTILDKRNFSVVKATTSETWLKGRIDDFQVDATVVPVDDYQAGIKRVLDRGADVFFGDRPILLAAERQSGSAKDLIVLDRQFTFESVALALARGDEDFRLLVDRTLSHLFASSEFSALYVKSFGRPSLSTATFFVRNALPD
jgi:polar amino acid transport system substrate-binding protein